MATAPTVPNGTYSGTSNDRNGKSPTIIGKVKTITDIQGEVKPTGKCMK